MVQVVVGALIAFLGLIVGDQAHIYAWLLIAVGMGIIFSAPVMPSYRGNPFSRRKPKLLGSESYEGVGLLPKREPAEASAPPPREVAVQAAPRLGDDEDEGFIHCMENVLAEEERAAKAYRINRNPGDPDYTPINYTWYEPSLDVLASRRNYDAGDAIVVRLEKLNYTDARAKWHGIKQAYAKKQPPDDSENTIEQFVRERSVDPGQESVARD